MASTRGAAKSGYKVMSVDYQIIPSLRLVYVEMARALSIQELVSHLEDLAVDDRYIPPMKKIVDFSNVDDAPMPKYDMKGFTRLQALYANQLRGERCVFVAPTDFRYGMGRLFEGYMGNAPLEVTVVRSLEAALELLDIDENEFRANRDTTDLDSDGNRA